MLLRHASRKKSVLPTLNEGVRGRGSCHRDGSNRRWTLPPPGPASATTVLMAHPSPAVLAALATTTGGHSRIVVSQFALGFLAGGFLCSAVLLGTVAFFALGAENFRRLLEFRRTVFRHVWGIFWWGLGAAKATLWMDDQWNWKEAWTVLKANLRQAQRAAKEGVEAIRLEAGLYAATVGKPGLVALQYSVNHLTPKFFAKTMEECLKETLAEIRDDNIDRVELTEFSVGRKAPELLDARAYELGDDAMAFDIDVRWRSEIEATMMVQTHRIKMSVPLTVRNVNFDGVIRVVLSPLTSDPPGFGAALVSLPATPTIGLDVRMAGGEITRMPWLRSEILNTLQRGIEDQFLWPRRVVIPSPRPPRNKKRVQTLLSKQELQGLEMDDPLLRAERRLAQNLHSMTTTPSLSHQPETDHLALKMDLTMKDSDCLKGLNDAQEELCIIDWDTFEVASSPKPTKASTTKEREKSMTTEDTFAQMLQGVVLLFPFLGLHV